MDKILIVTHVSGFVPQFEMNNVKIMQSMGYEVHYACNLDMPVYTDNNDRLEGTEIICHQIDFVRSPYDVKANKNAYEQLKDLMLKYDFKLVHCHTPMGSVLARLAAKATNTKPIMYTGHGFHFFKGAPIINWIGYYSVEWYLSRYTDAIITINQEDYKRIKKFPVRGNRVEYIPGIGIDLESYRSPAVPRQEIRTFLGVSEEDFMITSIGELTKRKNHIAVIKAIAEHKSEMNGIKYVICGSGEKENELKEIISELGIEEYVIMAGYRSDVADVLFASDCYVFPSLQEGLSVALMEAMAVGLPIICSRIRGNVDLLENKKGGFLVEKTNVESYAKAILYLRKHPERCKKMSACNKKNIKNFRKEIVIEKMTRIYQDILGCSEK